MKAKQPNIQHSRTLYTHMHTHAHTPTHTHPQIDEITQLTNGTDDQSVTRWSLIAIYQHDLTQTTISTAMLWHNLG